MEKSMLKKILQKWSLAIKIIPVIIAVVALKYLSHRLGLEVIALSALFTSLVAGTIFLIGFLISGVLSDYKESEKIPSELSACLESLYDESYTIAKSKNSKTAKELIEYQKSFIASIYNWFYKKEKTQSLLNKLSKMSDYFVELEKEGVQAGFIIKMKNEQNNIRKILLRIHTIRDTDFIASAYAIVEALAFSIIVGMILIKIEPFYESLFFTVLITFLLMYMISLIKDLDNPFDYFEKGETGTEIPLKPLLDFQKRINDAKFKA